MYAIISTGGKQYKVTENMILEVEKLPVNEKETYTFSDVLLVSGGANDILVGQPLVEGATVKAEVLAQDKDDKVIVFKYKRKTGYRRKNGHRQELTRLKIMEITAKGMASMVATEEVQPIEAQSATEEVTSPPTEA